MPAVINLSDVSQTALATALKAAIDAGGAASTIDIYTGTIGDAAGSTKLATVVASYPCGDVVSGNLEFDSMATTSALATGVAAWARFKTSAGDTVADVNVSSSGGTAFVRLNTTSFIQYGPVTIESCTFEF